MQAKLQKTTKNIKIDKIIDFNDNESDIPLYFNHIFYCNLFT